MSAMMKALNTSVCVFALVAGGSSSLILASITLLASTNAARALDVNCGNNSNTTTPGIDIVACGIFNNAGTSPLKGNNTAFGSYNSTLNGYNSTAIGTSNTVGINVAPFTGVTSGLAVGDSNKVQGDLSNAIGHQNAAYGARMNIVGSTNTVGVNGSPDISAGSSVFGNNNTITNTGVAVGETGSYAFGNGNYINGDQNVAIGLENVAGTDAASSRYSFVAGVQSKVYGFRSIAIGNAANAGTALVSADAAVAIGSLASAEGRYSTAIGEGTQALAEGATALGGGAAAYNASSTALGYGSSVTSDNSVALGANSVAAGIHTAGGYSINGGTPAGLPNSLNGVVSVGNVGAERQIQNVAAGVVSATSTDAVNGSQLYAVGSNVNALGTSTAAALGGGSTYTAGAGVSTPNYNLGGTSYTDVGAALTATYAKASGATPQSKYFTAYEAPGYMQDAVATGEGSVAMGPASLATGDYSSATGAGATATGRGSSAYGAGATANGANATAIGYNATVGVNYANSTAIGVEAKATRSNQMMLGTASTTYTAPGITSNASRLAQRGPTAFTTTDANGNLATSNYGPADIANLSNSVGMLSLGLTGVNNQLYAHQREYRQGIALAVAMPATHFPSAPGKTTLTVSSGVYKNMGAIGVAAMHRLNTSIPIAVGGTVSAGFNNSVAAKGEIVTEF